MDIVSELPRDETKNGAKTKKCSLKYNHGMLATIESTRTILGILQSPVTFAQSSINISEANHLRLRATKETFKSIYSTPHSANDSPVSLEKWNKSYESFEDSENVTPNSETARNNLSSKYDSEHARRIACENTIESLQEKVLSMGQENAVLKLENHKKDVELRKLQETLNQIKYSWKNTEDFLSSITESHSILERQLEEAKELNSNLTKELSNSRSEVQSLKRSEHQLQLKCDTELVKFPLEIENLTKQLENQEQRLTQFQKDIRSYQNDLFTVQKENQDIIRAKVKLETDHEKLTSHLTKKLSDMEQAKLDYTNINEKLQLENQTLTQSNENLNLQINNLVLEKDKLEVEFRKSEANKVVQDVENLAALNKTLSEKEAEFEEFRKKLFILKSEEMESLKSEYKNKVEEIRSQHRFQVGDLLNKIKETELSNQKCLDSTKEELKLAENKIEKLKSGRNKILSRLQIHLQNQWKESVELLYADEDFGQTPNEICEDQQADWLNIPKEFFNTPKKEKQKLHQNLSLVMPEFSSDTNQPSQNTPYNLKINREFEEMEPKTPKYNTNSETLQRYIKILLRESVTESSPEQISEPDLCSITHDPTQLKTKHNEAQANATNKMAKFDEKLPPWK